jgi:hypothetical protein
LGEYGIDIGIWQADWAKKKYMQFKKESVNRGLIFQSEGNRMIKDDRGMALLMVMICSTLFMLLGLSITFSSMTEFSTSNEFEAREKSLLIADAGFNLTKGIFRGNSLTSLLSSATAVDQYLSFPVPTGTTELSYFNRNPLSPIEAMHIDYASPPAAIGTRTINGLLTAPGGVSVGTGRYFARLTDNDDGDSDPLVDTDSVVTLRVMGVHRGSATEGAVYGTNTQNAIAIIESTLRRDTTFNFDQAFTIYGPNIDIEYNGNTFDLDGRQHALNGAVIAGAPKPGLGLMNNNPPNNASISAASAFTELAGMQMDNLVGTNGYFGPLPSLSDTTDSIITSADPDAANIFDPNWLMAFVDQLGAFANNVLPAGTYDSPVWGTTGAPEITLINGDAVVESAGSGAGLLVVNGDLNFNGAYTYTGLVFILGGAFEMSGANKNIIGGTFAANIIDNGDGTYDYGIPEVRFNGNSNFLYSAQAISLAYDLLPMRVLNWRESTREIEPY